MTEVQAIKLMQDSFDSMHRSGMLEQSIQVVDNTIILGSESSLDSLGFVTFISDIEDRVSSVTGQEHYLILTDIHEFNTEQTFLSAGTLAKYIEKLTA